MTLKLYEDAVEISVTDEGKGIEDIEKARQPMYTSRPDMERSGMDLQSWRVSWTGLTLCPRWAKAQP